MKERRKKEKTQKGEKKKRKKQKEEEKERKKERKRWFFNCATLNKAFLCKFTCAIQRAK